VAEVDLVVEVDSGAEVDSGVVEDSAAAGLAAEGIGREAGRE
jgi:hypothetical protein